MKILHYALGFPPYRTGGLTKFCMDLMLEQIKEGHEVSLLWPGKVKLVDRKIRIKRNRPVNGINSYEVINPTPISYDEGIINVEEFMKEGDLHVYQSFLHDLSPDVIHIHTLMGLHKNLLVAAKEKGIRLVFTTHDFFPICPKVTMFRNGDVCTTVDDCSFCPQCNLTALSDKKMMLLQSPVYRALKDSMIVRKLRKSQRDDYLSDSIEVSNNPIRVSSDYCNLRDFYKSMLKMMDFIHYNSSVTKSVYDQYLGIYPGKIITITHADIGDHRKYKNFNHTTLALTYLGNQGGSKGFFRLKAVLDQLYNNKRDFILNVFFSTGSSSIEMSPYIKINDRYSYDQLEEIMFHTDVVITPSVWYETFGYTVQEALSFGVPVIVSDHVGAKDIIPEGGGIIFHDDEELLKVISTLTPQHLANMNKAIFCAKPMKSEQDMCKEIINYGYQKKIDENCWKR
ncbi:glycosyltransferase [Stecheria sp. CLA-KB-P133]|uniref:Glycosyltransferase n=1 Tax=Grylomicrobium aquisgranensis TaxID=2926318 RepID=A0AB35U4K3_9FIRM|nr:glycosyltransferase [Stecheria sp. CLA-KB-P133]